jgi:hypothetical protein
VGLSKIKGVSELVLTTSEREELRKPHVDRVDTWLASAKAALDTYPDRPGRFPGS